MYAFSSATGALLEASEPAPQCGGTTGFVIAMRPDKTVWRARDGDNNVDLCGGVEARGGRSEGRNTDVRLATRTDRQRIAAGLLVREEAGYFLCAAA